MLSSVKKPRPAYNSFIYPYLIHTDSKGLVNAVCVEFSSLLKGYGITDYLYKPIRDIFGWIGHPSYRLTNATTSSKNDMPEIIDLFLGAPGKKSKMIRWICSPLAAEHERVAGLQLTGMEIPVPVNKEAKLQNEKLLPEFTSATNLHELIYLKTAIDHTAEAISITDKDFKIIYQNTAHVKIFKRSIQDWNSQYGILALFLDDPSVTQQLVTGLMQGKPWMADVKVKDKQGRSLYFLLRVGPVQNSEAEIIYYNWSFTDITAGKNNALQAEQFTGYLTHILDGITDGFFMLDKKLNVTFWNREAEKITGLGAEKILGHPILEQIPELIDAGNYTSLIRALKRKTSFTSDHYIKRLGLWLELNAHAYAEGLFVYFKDVTKRKKQEMLLELEKKVLEINSDQKASLAITIDYFLEGIEKIFPGMLCSVLLLEDDHVTLKHLSAPSLPMDYSAAIDGVKIGPAVGCCGTAAYSKKRIVVNDIATSPLWEDYKELALRFYLRSCWSLPVLNIHGEVIATFAMYYTHPKLPTETELHILDRAANLVKIIFENKQAEEKIRLINERYILATKATNDVIWDWDMKSEALFWGEGFYSQFGFKQGKKVNTVAFWETQIHPEDRGSVVSGLRKFISNNETGVWLEEYRFKKADGKYVLISNRGFLIYDKTGKVTRMVGSMQDITAKRELEQKLLKQELNKQKLILQAVVDAQESERAEIGKELHDNVNQILSTTKLYLELAGSDDTDRLNLIVRSTKNINHAINEIRNISRSLVPPSIGDLGLLDSINDLIENIRAGKALHVEFYPVGKFEDKISNQQKLMIFRIIQEQASNVLKHAEAQNLIIELILAENKNRIELNITDDGKGFEPSKMKNKKGLGLSNISSRADLLGGQMSIVSAKGKGCKLSVMVPIQNL